MAHGPVTQGPSGASLDDGGLDVSRFRAAVPAMAAPRQLACGACSETFEEGSFAVSGLDLQSSACSSRSGSRERQSGCRTAVQIVVRDRLRVPVARVVGCRPSGSSSAGCDRDLSGSKRGWRQQSVQGFEHGEAADRCVVSNDQALQRSRSNKCIFCRTAEPAIAGHELLADHLVRVEAEAIEDATFHA